MSQAAFHKFEDHLRSQEQKRNRLRDAEAEADRSSRGIGDPSSPRGAGYRDALNPSNQALPLVSTASPLRELISMTTTISNINLSEVTTVCCQIQLKDAEERLAAAEKRADERRRDDLDALEKRLRAERQE